MPSLRYGCSSLAICLALSAFTARAEEAAITLTRVAGTVESLHAEETGGVWLAALPGDEFGPGWSLRTAAASKAQLVFPLDNVVILRENSLLIVNALDSGGGAVLEATRGGLLVDIQNKLAGGSEFSVETGVAQAIVRGTQFGLEFAPPGWRAQTTPRVRFFGYRGVAEVRNDQGSEPLGLDEEVEVVAGGKPAKARKGLKRGKRFRELLELTDLFEQFEREHPVLDGLIESRNEQRKVAKDKARLDKSNGEDRVKHLDKDKDKDKDKNRDKRDQRDSQRDRDKHKPNDRERDKD